MGGAGPGSPTTVGGVGITIRPVRSGEDYAAWRQVLLTVEPGERAPTAGELRAQAGPQQRFFVAELDGRLAGSAFVAPRVLPACRRQGVGSSILRLLAEQAAAMGFGVAGGIVEDPGSAHSPVSPAAALARTKVRHVLPLQEIGGLLSGMVKVGAGP